MLAKLTHPCSGAFGDLVRTYLRGFFIFSIFSRRSRTTFVWCENFTSHVLVMGGGVVFCPIICSRQRPRAPINLNCFLLMPRSRSQWKCMSMAFVCFGWTHKLMMPSTVELSVWMGEGGCVCPISFKILCSLTPFCAFMYNAPILASVAEDITALIMDALL